MKIKIGQNKVQKEGFTAFVTNAFPQKCILELKDEKETYDRTFVYRKYINIFMK